MATQRLEVAQLSAAMPFPAAPPIPSYAAQFASAQAIATGDLRPQPKGHPDGAVDLRLLGKGVGWALGIEGVTALGVYAAWFLWHFRP